MMYESFPLALVGRIGTYSTAVAEQAAAALAGAPTAPQVTVRPDWYF